MSIQYILFCPKITLFFNKIINIYFSLKLYLSIIYEGRLFVLFCFVLCLGDPPNRNAFILFLFFLKEFVFVAKVVIIHRYYEDVN